jgi:hypothetical protein
MDQLGIPPAGEDSGVGATVVYRPNIVVIHLEDKGKIY